MENETGCRVKAIYSDNNGEYCNQSFKMFFSEKGIRMVKMIPMTPS